MCIFSLTTEQVSRTQIFARLDGASQILVYSMSIQADQELAMVLPLPVPLQSRENAIGFINLEGCPKYFSDLSDLFPTPWRWGIPQSSLMLGMDDLKSLEVHSVGMFEASIVPTVRDFQRLEPRFRLPSDVWDRLPQYHDWGFAVFKLKKTLSAVNRIHPMALAFHCRDSKQLFFPTVHVHDGQVHNEAYFDHELYFQTDHLPAAVSMPGVAIEGHHSNRKVLAQFTKQRLEKAKGPLARHINMERTAGTLSHAAQLYRCQLEGRLPNQDTFFFMER